MKRIYRVLAPGFIAITLVSVLIFVPYQFFFVERIEKDCSYVLPNQYYLVQDSVTKEYAIMFMHIDTYRHFLGGTWKNAYTGYWLMSNMESASYAKRFKDSCEAKWFCKMYLERTLQKNADRFK